jgi:predicted nuclease of restriction endonuclease-like RecB superfamily
MSMLSLAEVRWRTRKHPDGGPPLIQVAFLRHADDPTTAATVGGIISYFASLVGQPRRTYDADVPATIAGDRILGRGLALACGHWYRWQPLDFAAALPPDVTEALSRAGIDTPSALRLRLFDLANDRYPGFVPSARRSEALAALARSLRLSPDDAPHLDRAMVLDAEAEAVLVAAEPQPAVAEVVARYNQGALAAMLRHAVRLVFTLDSPDGGLIRRLYAFCRRLGVYCDIERAGLLGDAIQLTLAGPDAVVGPPAAPGPRLASVARYLLGQMGSLDEAFADLIVRDRPCRLPLDRALRGIPGLAGETTDGTDGDDDGPARVAEDRAAYDATTPTFDSEVEARLAREFAALRRQGRVSGWRLVREPAPLLAGRRVLVPDFALLRGDTRVFVEVAGFWTEGYLTKKRQALEQLPPRTPLLLAVAPPAAAALAGLPFPMVPYRDTVPVSRLLAAAEAHFGEFDTRTAGAAERLTATCAADTSGRVPEESLAGVLGCYSPGEIARTLATLSLPAGWTYLPGVGLTGPGFQRAVDAALAETWAVDGPGRRLSLSEVRSLLADVTLPEGDEALIALLEQRPSCRVVRDSLFAVAVCPPGNQPGEPEAATAGEPPPPRATAGPGNDATGVASNPADRRSPRRRRRATPTAKMPSLL